MVSRFMRIGFVIAALTLGGVEAGRCQLLVSPSGGTVLFDDSGDVDDGVAFGRDLGFVGTYFGNPVSSVDVSTNGNLNLAVDGDYYNVPLPDPFAIARISPLWDDLILRAGDGATISESVDPGNYYAVTWQRLEANAATPIDLRDTFQVVWFGAPVTIGGFEYLPDDIVFAYAALDAPFVDDAGAIGATVGLDAGDASAYAPLVGTVDGLVIDANRSKLSFPGTALVFRPDGAGSYMTLFVPVSPTPEPAGAVFAAAGLIAALAWRASRGPGGRRAGLDNSPGVHP